MHHTQTLITHYTHFFTIKTTDKNVLNGLYKVVDKYTERVWTEAPNRKPFFLGGNIFAGRVVDNSEFRLLIGQYDEFMRSCMHCGVLPDRFVETHADIYVPQPHDYALTKEKSLYDYQDRARMFSLDAVMKRPFSSLIGMPTGTGKTVTLCSIAASVKKRFAVAVLPKYMEKWGFDIASNLAMDPKEIMLVSGSSSLAGLIELVKTKPHKAPHTIVLSITTMRLFIEAYSEDPELCAKDYGCIPQDIWSVLGIGLVGIDEAHEHLHEIYTLISHIHGPKLVALSGTMLSERGFESMVQKTIFPYSIRFNDIKMKKYIKAFQLMYSLSKDHFSKIKTTERGRSTYSHTAYEKSIYKHPDLLRNYIQLIKDTIQTEYLDQYKPGDKLAIYASTIHMCSILTNAIKKWVGHKLDVRRYVEKDPYENVIQADIRVTTIIKAGTAIDIPNLRVVITTVSVSSHKSVIQLLGRLRELKDRDTRMYYLYCSQIKKHMEYASSCRDLVQDRVISIKTIKVNQEL